MKLEISKNKSSKKTRKDVSKEFKTPWRYHLVTLSGLCCELKRGNYVHVVAMRYSREEPLFVGSASRTLCRKTLFHSKQTSHGLLTVPINRHYWTFGCGMTRKGKVYNPKPRNRAKLKAAIVREIEQITPETCRNAKMNIFPRLEQVLELNGSHFEHLL